MLAVAQIGRTGKLAEFATEREKGEEGKERGKGERETGERGEREKGGRGEREKGEGGERETGGRGEREKGGRGEREKGEGGERKNRFPRFPCFPGSPVILSHLPIFTVFETELVSC